MTQHKRLKREIRERMAKTGEAYTTARLHIVGGSGSDEPANDAVQGQSAPAPKPPRLLLDANVFRALANEHSLDQYKDRLRRIAECRRPPLLWVCPMTFFEELLGHVHVAARHRFDEIRTAVLWVHRLCGDVGIAEGMQWVALRTVFAAPQPYDRLETDALIQVKNEILAARVFDELPADLLTTVEAMRALHFEKVDRWVAHYTELLNAAREPRKAGDEGVEGKQMVTRAILEVLRKHARAFEPAWGALKSEGDQAARQEEMIAFELARLLKGAKDPKYKVSNYKNDYNDRWLCAYPAVGYTLVTGDDKLRRSLIDGGCKDPRVVEVGQAVEIAEAFLRNR